MGGGTPKGGRVYSPAETLALSPVPASLLPAFVAVCAASARDCKPAMEGTSLASERWEGWAEDGARLPTLQAKGGS
eukprot:scaffold165326_cov19-Tisochrysis_lutea.AAC.2